MRAEQSRLRSVCERVGSRVHSSWWQGRDAQRFASRWQHVHTRVGEALDSLGVAAGNLERNAAEQERASDAAGVPGGTGRSGSPAVAAGDEGRGATSRVGLPPADVMSAVGEDPGKPPVGEPLATRTESWELSGALAAGIGVSGTARLTIEELPGGASMVWIEDRDGASLSGGISGGIGVEDGVGIELGGDASVSAATLMREGWMVGSDDVSALLARLGIRELTGAGGLSPGLPGDTGALGELLTEPITGLFGLDAPEPRVTDRMVDLGVSAGLVGSAAAPLLGISGTLGGVAGVRQRPGGTSLMIELRGNYATQGAAADLVGSPSAARTTTLEVPLQEDSAHRVVVTRTVDVPGGEVVTRSVHAFDRDRALDSARRAASEILSGRGDSAPESIGALLASIESDPVWSDSMGGVVNDDVHTVGLGAALGPDLSGSLTGGRRVVTYQR